MARKIAVFQDGEDFYSVISDAKGVISNKIVLEASDLKGFLRAKDEVIGIISPVAMVVKNFRFPFCDYRKVSSSVSVQLTTELPGKPQNYLSCFYTIRDPNKRSCSVTSMSVKKELVNQFISTIGVEPDVVIPAPISLFYWCLKNDVIDIGENLTDLIQVGYFGKKIGFVALFKGFNMILYRFFYTSGKRLEDEEKLISLYIKESNMGNLSKKVWVLYDGIDLSFDDATVVVKDPFVISEGGLMLSENTRSNVFCDFLGKHEGLGKFLVKNIKLVNLLCGVLLFSTFIYFSSGVLSYYTLLNKEKLIKEKMTYMFKHTFGDNLKVVDPLSQARGILMKIKGEKKSYKSFLDILGKINDVISKVEGVVIESLKFSDRGEISLSGIAQDFKQVKQIQEGLLKLNEVKSVTLGGAQQRLQGGITFNMKINWR